MSDGTVTVGTEANDALNRIADAFPLVTSRGGDVEQLARVAGVPPEVAQHALDHHADRLLQAQAAAEADGSLLKPVAARLTLSMLRTLDAAMQAGELDADDIDKLLPKVHRVVEHADRIDASRGRDDDRLATFQITFITGGGIHGRIVPAGADVVDVPSAEVPD